MICRQEPDETSSGQTPPKNGDRSSDQKDSSENSGKSTEDSKKSFPLFGAKLDGAAEREWTDRIPYYSRNSYENLVDMLNNDSGKLQAFKEELAKPASVMESDM